MVITSGEGAWVTDVTGRRYLDFLAGYSALNFGHRHPALVAAAVDQLGRVTLTSRAFHHNLLGAFCRELAQLTGTEMVLPMNTGAETVESAIKVARLWAHRVKGVPDGTAEIVVTRGTSTAAPPPLSRSPPTRWPGLGSARSPLASSWCPTVTLTRYGAR